MKGMPWKIKRQQQKMRERERETFTQQRNVKRIECTRLMHTHTHTYRNHGARNPICRRIKRKSTLESISNQNKNNWTWPNSKKNEMKCDLGLKHTHIDKQKKASIQSTKSFCQIISHTNKQRLFLFRLFEFVGRIPVHNEYSLIFFSGENCRPNSVHCFRLKL